MTKNKAGYQNDEAPHLFLRPANRSHFVQNEVVLPDDRDFMDRFAESLKQNAPFVPNAKFVAVSRKTVSPFLLADKEEVGHMRFDLTFLEGFGDE